MSDLERINSRDYDEETVEQALIRLVHNDFNVKRTVRELAADGTPIPERTLSDWKRRYPNRLRFYAVESGPQIEQELVHKQRAIASAAIDASMEAVQKEREKIERGDVRDYAASARNLATVSAISTDKLLALTGRPNTIVGSEKKPEAILAEIQRLAPQIIDSTAEEIEDGS